MSLAILLLFALMAACTPAVRYASDEPAVVVNDNVSTVPINNNNTAQDDATADQSIPDIALRNDATPKDNVKSNVNPNPKKVAVKKRSPQHLAAVIQTYIGTPYKYGGMSRSTGVDCSGFVSLVFKEVYGMSLPRSSRGMWREGKVVPVTAARPGDLVFFKGGSFSTVDHVGIYLGNNRFAHASTKAGVTYSNLKDTYYARRLAGVKRVL